MTRIASLDVIRGVAVLGILLMNVVSFGIGIPAYFNLDFDDSRGVLDRSVGVAGELLADQKFMAIFSLLFGAGIVLFYDRAVLKGRRAVWLSLWRNLLLAVIGLLHTLVWDGDVLFVYAVCAPFVILARRWSDITLAVLGAGLVALPPVLAVVAQASVTPDGVGLGDYWGVAGEMSDEVGIWLITDFFARAAGLMLLGVVAYRRGFVTAELDRSIYWRWAVAGCSFGILSAGAGVVWLHTTDFSTDVAVVASIPNTVGTIPFSLGIVAAVILAIPYLGRAGDRLSAVGRMALTNYLAQTALCVTFFDAVLDVDPSRTALLGVVGAIWLLQLWWSIWWLDHFRYGPVEWLWRAATYRTIPSMRVS